ncbi:MAG: DUF3786 domain-containing protein [Deltaproteobacteria bacterium]|nr:DUF3786 domain-containing protein [Deltaproteobacteria bacterium]MBW2150801.1 DUF3786 domain-containing protein [Deltaproteobacteria bacterium]
MPRIDDYLQAKQLAAERLSKEPLGELIERSGFDTFDEQTIKASFLNRIYKISYPSFAFQDISSEDLQTPIQEHVLILHYLQGSGKAEATDVWITYREIPDASFYYSAFIKRAIEPLKKVFGQNLTGFTAAARQLGGKRISHGDAAFEFKIFPKVAIRIILWKADEEFPPEANILFDKSIAWILSPEDIAWLCGLFVYRLIGIARKGPEDS